MFGVCYSVCGSEWYGVCFVCGIGYVGGEGSECVFGVWYMMCGGVSGQSVFGVWYKMCGVVRGQSVCLVCGI